VYGDFSATLYKRNKVGLISIHENGTRPAGLYPVADENISYPYTRVEVKESIELRKKLKSSLKTLIKYITNFNASVEFIFRKLLKNKVYNNICASKCQEVRKPQILPAAVMIHRYWQWEGFQEFAAFFFKTRSIRHFFPSCNSVYMNFNFLSSTALECCAHSHMHHISSFI
jgi:hypothetical protein